MTVRITKVRRELIARDDAGHDPKRDASFAQPLICSIDVFDREDELRATFVVRLRQIGRATQAQGDGSGPQERELVRGEGERQTQRIADAAAVAKLASARCALSTDTAARSASSR